MFGDSIFSKEESSLAKATFWRRNATKEYAKKKISMIYHVH